MFRLAVAVFCSLLLNLHAARAQQKSASSVFAENRMAIVHVQVDADPMSPNKQPSYGTGFIIGSDGYVLTAKHVLSSYVSPVITPISVRIGSLDGQQVAADYLPFDIGVDVAMLKLRNPSGVGLTAYRTVLRGDSTKSGSGNTVYIVGFNLSSNISIAQGLIASNLGGGVGGNLQWDIQGAGIVFGMSGAPVFNDSGEVIGLITGGQPGTGIEFAYPEQLLENFAVIPGWKRTQPAPTPPPSSGTSGGPVPGSGSSSGDAIVMDGNVNYDQSGFSFARNLAVAWNSPDADILVATADKQPSSLAQFFLPYDVPPYASPQDAGAHSGIQQVSTAASNGPSSCPTSNYQYHWFVARQGATYCIRSRNAQRFIRITVSGIFKDRIAFSWTLAN